MIFRNKIIDNFDNTNNIGSGIGINPDGTYCQINSNSINNNCKSININNLDYEINNAKNSCNSLSELQELKNKKIKNELGNKIGVCIKKIDNKYEFGQINPTLYGTNECITQSDLNEMRKNTSKISSKTIKISGEDQPNLDKKISGCLNEYNNFCKTNYGDKAFIKNKIICSDNIRYKYECGILDDNDYKDFLKDESRISNKCYRRNSNFDEICRNFLDNDNVGYQQIVENQCLNNKQMIDKSMVKVICSPLYRNGVYLYPPGSRVSECIKDSSDKLINFCKDNQMVLNNIDSYDCYPGFSRSVCKYNFDIDSVSYNPIKNTSRRVCKCPKKL
jgi:hypothetical protein